MGRHSASYLAALSARPATTSAARYIGRVGALALAMGVGAAMSGGAGLAHADGTTDNDTADGTPAHSSPEPTSTAAGPTETATNGSSGAEAEKPTTPTVPKMQGLSGGVKTAAEKVADPEPESLAGLISRIPNQIVAMFGGAVVPGTTTPTSVKPAPQNGSQLENQPGDQSALDTPKSAKSTFASIATDDPAPARAVAAQPRAVVASTPVDPAPRQRLITQSVTTTVPESVTTLPPVPSFVNPITTIVSGFLNALGFAPTAGAGHSPIAPMPFVLGVLQLISREIERIFVHQTPSTATFTSAEAYANAHPALAATAPSPGDEVTTAYGDIGKWMLESDGQISNYGGQPYGGKELLESVNVIIVDPSATTSAEAAYRLNNAMWWSGFPAQPIHSTGFLGSIDDITYGQQPSGLLQGFSNNFFVLPNDHGRIFGPDPVETNTGYVWSGSFSTETLTIYNFLPGHAYVSSDMARTALATQLILSGKAKFVGMVPLDNAYDTDTTTTGDHDGYAVVLQLT